MDTVSETTNAREFVADMTGRMGLPQLHIGMMKLHLEGPNEVENGSARLATYATSPTALPGG